MRPAPSFLGLLLAALLPAIGGWGLPPRVEAAASLRFHGNGVNDIDRVKVRIDPPDATTPGPPADIGATDFTIEFRLRAEPGSNPAGPIACGPGVAWIEGHIVLDRDRYNQDRKFGISLADGRVAFGVSGEGTGDHTVCGTTDLRDGAWHHVAVARRRSDGRMWLFVDGAPEAEEDGPDGDASYPDDGVPGNSCGGPCTNSDPFLVFGAEKHDAGPAYPSFDGWLDEVRLSTTLRYSGPFSPPAAPFLPDPATAALWHFDEGSGDSTFDASGAPGGPSHGELRLGGAPVGPEWSVDAFAGSVDAADRLATVAVLSASPNPTRGAVRFRAPAVRRGDGSRPAALVVVDPAGRRVARVAGRAAGEALEFDWDGRGRGGRPVAPGVYLARVEGGAQAVRVVVR
jgi:hypothetical protein